MCMFSEYIYSACPRYGNRVMSVLHGDIWRDFSLNRQSEYYHRASNTYIHKCKNSNVLFCLMPAKHKPDSHIMPYWSDSMSRKLPENTNTAWGGSLKLETSLLSLVFSSSGNHLVAHAYQVLSTSLRLRSAFTWICFLLQCLRECWLLKRKARLRLQTNRSYLYIWLFCRDAVPHKRHEQPFLIQHSFGSMHASSDKWQGYGGRMFTGTKTTLF